MLVAEAEVVKWRDIVWQLLTTPKHAMVMWMAIKGRLATKDRLVRFGASVDACCCLCKAEPETHSHLFFRCPVADQILKCVCQKVCFSYQVCDLEALLEQFCNAHRKNNELYRMRVAAICSTVYAIWRLRNRVLFTGAGIDIERIVFMICASLRNRWLGVGVKQNRKTMQIGRNVRLW